MRSVNKTDEKGNHAQLIKMERMLDGLRFDFNLELIKSVKVVRKDGSLQVVSEYRRLKKGSLKAINEALQSKCKAMEMQGISFEDLDTKDIHLTVIKM